MTSLWVLLLVYNIRRGLGWSGRRKSPPASKLGRCFRSTPAYPVRDLSVCHLAAASLSNGRLDKQKTETLGYLSWLSVEGSHRLAYRHFFGSNEGDGTAVLVCNGFRSDMSGTKVAALEDHCLKRGWEFCVFDYRGHGSSSGNFEDCTLSDWIQDASDILDHVLLSGRKKQNVILVGSSMGGWISVHLALRYNKKFSHEMAKQPESSSLPIAGILGIASGPDFLQDLYSSSTTEQQAEWRSRRMAHIPSRYGDPYPISWNLIQDAAQHWGILPSTKPIGSAESQTATESNLSVCCPVRLLHGKCDEDVSWKKSKELANILQEVSCESDKSDNPSTDSENDVILSLIEDGDHRLSRPQDIELILDTLDELVSSL